MIKHLTVVGSVLLLGVGLAHGGEEFSIQGSEAREIAREGGQVSYAVSVDIKNNDAAGKIFVVIQGVDSGGRAIVNKMMAVDFAENEMKNLADKITVDTALGDQIRSWIIKPLKKCAKNKGI